MLSSDARGIIQALADGLDPATQCALQDCPVLHQPEVIRALYKAVEALGRDRSTQRADGEVRRKAHGEAKAARTDGPAHAGRKWTEEEDRELEQEFHQQLPIKDIALAHGRSRGSITSRLVKLGCLADPALAQTRPAHARSGPVTPPAGEQPA